MMKFISLLPVLLLLTACGHKVQPGQEAVAKGVALPADAVLHVVQAAPFAERLDVMGTVASAARAQISARLSAHVEQVFATAGQTVTNGQILARLDDRDLREQLAAADAQRVQAETEWKRAVALFEKQAATEQMKTTAESGFRAAAAQVERLKVMLSWAEVRSPIAGTVTDRQIDAGDLANPGQVLLSIYDPAQLRLEANVPARLVGRLKLGDEVEVTLENPARATKGRVEEIVSEADSISRTQKVKVRLAGAEGLRPGQFGRLWITDAERPATFIPSSAIFCMGQLEFVQVARDGRAERRLVRTGRAAGDSVELLSGIQAGEKILVHPVM